LMALGAAALAEVAVVIAIGVLRSEKKVGGKGGGGGIQKKTQKQGQGGDDRDPRGSAARACVRCVGFFSLRKRRDRRGCECLVRL
jgi:hypothetical protein